MGADTLDPQWQEHAALVARLIEASLRAAPRPPDQEFFDIDDAARILGLTPKALRCYIELGTGPRVLRPNGKGRIMRFHRDDLTSWLRQEQPR